ncbi:tRNA (guanosine(46)-N7)-methyltransferase TrmB [Myxococcota bacterium]|nr:tRNA (guanosine(46)-N7)-methyltransferase TrmB [Myxococcota bacterium]MBU1536373.1 tRNA (guanosine(46)-N7)-methyltransferase TrmB [Myxococcota bacterium]
MSRRFRHHVNPLSEQYLAFTPNPPTIVGTALEVELGCAEGEFLFRRAMQKPGHQVVGVEIRRDLVARINSMAGDLPPDQIVQGIFANLNIHVPVLFARETVDRFFINFPDPWFKKQHHKRRVLTPELLGQLCDALKPDGELFFQSDIFDLALDALAVFEEFGTGRIRNVLGPWSFMGENPYGVPTRRELHVTEKGGPIWRMLYTPLS